jgi:C4-dicarboxylate transporter DctM subunit
MGLVWITARRRNFPKTEARLSLRAVLRTLRGAVLGLVVPVIILGGILGGVFTPTEAGAVAVLYAVVIGVVVLRTLGARELGQSLLAGAKTSAIIYLLLGTSNVVSWILVRHQVPKTLAAWSLELTSSATVFIVITIVVLFLLGLALEAVPIMIMLIPVLAPAAAAYRIDPHHLGLIIVMAVQTALLSPPVALSLYVVTTVINCPMRDANREVWKFVAAVLAVTVVTALWPAMSMAIPRLFGF